MPFSIVDAGSTGKHCLLGQWLFFEMANAWFLITNWHNVSGRDFLTREPLSYPPQEPISLTATWSSYEVGDRASRAFGIAPHHINLYDGENPVWFEHPVLGAACDVVAIPMERPESCPEFHAQRSESNKHGQHTRRTRVYGLSDRLSAYD